MPDPSFVIPLLWQSAVLPFGVALALLFALRRTSGPLAAFALAAGFVASYFAVFHAQWSPLPKTALDWLLWLALAGTAGAVLAERLPRAAARMIVRLLLSLASAALVVWPALPSLGLQAAGMLAISAGVLICVAWSGLAWTAQSQSRPTPAPLLMVIAGGAGLVLMLDASAALGQLSGALAAALAASALFQLPRARIAFSGAAVGATVLLLGALLLNAHVYAAFSGTYIALLACGLLADPLVAGINRLRGRPGGAGSSLLTVALGAIPVLTVIALALKTAQESGGY